MRTEFYFQQLIFYGLARWQLWWEALPAAQWLAGRGVEVDLVRCLISNGTLGQAQIILMSLC